MYQNIGYRVKPEGMYIPECAKAVISRGENYPAQIAEYLLAVGGKRSNNRLRNIMLEDFFAAETDVVAPGTPFRNQVIHLFVKILAHAGYLRDAVPMIERVTNPVVTIDEVAMRITTQNLVYPTAADFGGEFATIGNLTAFSQRVIPELAYCVNDGILRRTVERLRLMVGHIGYKLRKNEAITQAERTFFMLYKNTEEGTPGFSEYATATPIRCAEQSDPLIFDAFRQACGVAEGGPFWRNFRIHAVGPMEQFIILSGFVPPRVTTRLGYSVPLGPFREPRYEILDDMPWTIQQQLDAMYDRTAYISTEGKAAAGYDSLLPVTTLNIGYPDKTDYGFILDDPGIKLRLVDDSDCSKIIWSYNSMFAERELNSQVASIDPGDFIAEVAWRKKDYGANAFSQLEVSEFGLADYSLVEDDFTNVADQELNEEIAVVDKTKAKSLKLLTVNMADYYLRRGSGMTRSMFASIVDPPRTYLEETDENALLFIAARLGLTRDDMIRFRRAISISHQAARWKRLTGKEMILDWKGLIAATTGYSF